jgi:RNA polymerase sigma factor (sigma-70 family)
MEASAVPWWAPAGVTGVASPKLLRLASDDRLVALIRAGNPAAFEAAYDRHHRPILLFCRHVLGSADEAEDAVQHTFFAAYRDLIASEKPVHLRPWLFTIARNRCYSILRARREQPVGALAEQADEGLSSEVQRRQDLRDLVLDLRRLPVEQRSALVLAELDALSHDEIGVVLGVPREKVKALVFQARESLIASRDARETDCHEIRAQLMTMHGGALRRGNLRRHLRECEGCREFRSEFEHQRRRLALILPVAPTIALKEGVIGAVVGGSAAAGVAGGGVLAGMALKGSAIKGVVAAALGALGTAGTLVAVGTLAPAISHSSRSSAPQRQTARAERLFRDPRTHAAREGSVRPGLLAGVAFSAAGRSTLGALGLRGSVAPPLAGIGVGSSLLGGRPPGLQPGWGKSGSPGGVVTIGTAPSWSTTGAGSWPPVATTPVDGLPLGGMQPSGRQSPSGAGSAPSGQQVGFSGRTVPSTTPPDPASTPTAATSDGETPSGGVGQGDPTAGMPATPAAEGPTATGSGSTTEPATGGSEGSSGATSDITSPHQ